MHPVERFVVHTAEQNHDTSLGDVSGVALGDSLAVAGCKVLRHHYDHAGGREAWLLTSLSDATPSRVANLQAASRRLRADLRLFERGFRGKFIRPIARHVRDLSNHLRRTSAFDTRLDVLGAYVERCDEDARTGLEPVARAWRAGREAQTVKLIALLNGDVHQEWLDSMDVLSMQADADRGDDAVARVILPGEPSHVRHIWRAAMEARWRDVRAFDTLPDLPAPEHILALRNAIDRLCYTAEAFGDVLPEAQAHAILPQCATAHDAYSAVCDAHDAATYALQFASQSKGRNRRDDERHLPRATSKGAMTFADAQQKVIEARLLNWRDYLHPFL